MAERVDYERAHDEVMRQIDFRKFFRKCGLTITKKLDGNWFEAAGNIVGDRGRVNVETGDWDSGKHKGSIYNFLIRLNGWNAGDAANLSALRVLCEFTRVLFPETGDEIPEIEDEEELLEVEEVERFSEINDPKYLDKPVRVPMQITGESSIVFDSPGEFFVQFCNDLKRGKCKRCKDKTFEIDPGMGDHIALLGANESIRDMICQRICCPFGKKPVVSVTRKLTYRRIKASDYLPRTIEREGFVESKCRRGDQKDIYIKLDEGKYSDIIPRPYMAEGWVRTNPRTSERTMIVTSLVPIKEEWECFTLERHKKRLNGLKALGWRKIVEEVNKLFVKVYGCDELLVSVLLTYCSPMHFIFNTIPVNGWIKIAVIGGSGVGKSVVFENISRAVGIGDIFSCLTGKRTGLSYATLKLNSGYFETQSGLYPQNSKKILCIEEAQEMPRNDMKSIGMAMENGILKVNNAARGDYESKTRLVINCNPPKDKTINQYTFGCNSLSDVFAYMFVRRLDFAVFMKRNEDNSCYNQKNVPIKEKWISKEMLRSLVHYAWTLEPDKIVFEPEAEEAILKHAKGMSDIYGHPEDIQLVCPGDFRYTIARMSVAWAILDVNIDDEGKLTVSKKYVELVRNFMNSMYSADHVLLDQYSLSMKKKFKLSDYKVIAAAWKRLLETTPRDVLGKKVPFAAVVEYFLTGGSSTQKDLNAAFEGKRVTDHVNLLVAHDMIYRQGTLLKPSPRIMSFWKRFKKEYRHLGVMVENIHEMMSEAEGKNGNTN